VEQAEVLIISDQEEFVRSLVQSWQGSHIEQEYSVSSPGTEEFPASPVIVIDASDTAAASQVLAHLHSETSLVVAITGEEPLPDVGSTAQRVVQVRRGLGSIDVAAALAHQGAQRVAALRRVEDVEHRLRESERYAVLGKFISEARHGLGNALTSVLGNSELVLLETAETGLPSEVRGQLETIHAMSLRIHETLRRLSSLDMEMQMAERQAGRKTVGWPIKSAAAQ